MVLFLLIVSTFLSSSDKNYFKKTNPFLKVRRENNFFPFYSFKNVCQEMGRGAHGEFVLHTKTCKYKILSQILLI